MSHKQGIVKQIIQAKKTPEQIFNEEYHKLVEKTGIDLSAYPVFLPRDDGTFSIQVRWKLVKKDK